MSATDRPPAPARPEPVVLNDFRAQWERIRGRAQGALERVGSSGRLILGPEVAAFETALAARWGLSHAVGCGNGLDAIEIGLRALGLAPGETVLTTPLSAFATTLAILRAGGRPAFVDVDESGLVDLDACEEFLRRRPRTRFLVPVHLYGHALDLARLQGLRDRHGLRIVEDCAQAIDARGGDRGVGTVGQVAAVSFYPTKNLGALGDGGALLTADPPIAARARSLRDYGQSGRYRHEHLGLNSRLDELQAAILRDALLPLLDEFTAARRRVAARYRAGLDPAVVRPLPIPAGSEGVWHLFPVLVPGDRAAFRAHLELLGILTGEHYPVPIPDQAALSAAPGPCEVVGGLPRARAIAASEVSLPIHPFLGDAEVERVIDACNAWRGGPCTP